MITPEERDAVRRWLFAHCTSYEEYKFFDALYDDLDEMYTFLDSMEPDSWYGFVDPEWRVG